MAKFTLEQGLGGMRLCFMRSNGSRGGGRGLGDRQGESCASGGLVNRRRRLPPATGTGMSSGCFMCRRTASTPPRWPLLPGPRDSYMNPASNPSRLQGLTFSIPLVVASLLGVPRVPAELRDEEHPGKTASLLPDKTRCPSGHDPLAPAAISTDRRERRRLPRRQSPIRHLGRATG